MFSIITATTAPPTVFQRSPAMIAVILDHLCGYALPDALPVHARAPLADGTYCGFTRLAAKLRAQAGLSAGLCEDKGSNGGRAVELDDQGYTARRGLYRGACRRLVARSKARHH
ncbi:hypothetical protein AURDEDRAFT_159297 [Auricularia subglabra TFB-10046 SS5]|nr:hypothetical protein AURDEDRAFT_159297 [Auricularia subglabra TFB-10046 SS5]